MTTREMHIQLDLELQKLDSFNTKNLLPQEKDWFLNNEVLKFIKSRIDPKSNIKGTGFQSTNKRLDDLKDFISLDPKLIKNEEGSYMLPSDFLYPVRIDVNSYKDCDGIDYDYTDITYYKHTIDLNFLNSISAYKIFTKYADSVEPSICIFDIDTLPSSYLNKDTLLSNKFLLLRALQIELETELKELYPSAKLYWDVKKKFTLTVITDKQIILTLDRANTVNDVEATVTIIENEEVTSNLLPTAEARIQKEEAFTDTANSSLTGALQHSPLARIRNSSVYIHSAKSVIVSTVAMAYIRKPRFISLSLNSNIETDYDTSIEIVSNTVRFLKSIVDTGNYEQYIRENTLIE